VDRVEAAEQRQVAEVHQARDDIAEVGAGRLEQRRGIAERLLVCSSMVAPRSAPVAGSNPPWPDRNSQSPTCSAGEYGPAGAGAAAGVVVVWAYLGCAP
jgi:hypothetical protein